MTVVTEPAPAKLNLALHVRGRAPDGYHRLETIFAFVEFGDRLHFEPASELTLTIAGPFAPALADEDNLVLRAVRAR
ncbi:MAG: 4-(cytidine 5'-diphospho)-2-C-methyl-D-erythritol kinase, partial [Polymorphobacter sp.]